MSSRSRHKYQPQVLLGSDSHVMQWNPVLGIFRLATTRISRSGVVLFRVNRYQKQFTLDTKIERFK